ncbi:hypothetical protein HPB48_020313 [Haemaphysalis longicornis]|uniref:Uncharacterized protein n=1 Tax=Haemaphysalis longicornis TaxID=44386 RepID=A0A9J6GSR7_HAELO|nr:hypothetical protein HPB48_020313 [Haemaphysalis longicornis]
MQLQGNAHRMLRRQIVCEIRSVETQRALLARPKLTLQEADDIVLAAEAARQDAKLLKAADMKVEPELHKLASERVHKSLRKSTKDRQGPSIACDRCGSQKNSKATCTFKMFQVRKKVTPCSVMQFDRPAEAQDICHYG